MPIRVLLPGCFDASCRLNSENIGSIVNKFGLSIRDVDAAFMKEKFSSVPWTFEPLYYVLDFEKFTSPVPAVVCFHPQLSNSAVFLDGGKVYFPAKELRSFLLSQFEQELQAGLKHYASEQFQFADPRFASSLSQMTSLVGSPVFANVQLVGEEPAPTSEVSVESLPAVRVRMGREA